MIKSETHGLLMLLNMFRFSEIKEDGLSDLAKFCSIYTSIISLKCTDTSELLYLLSIHETLLLCQIEDLQWRVYLATRLILDAIICAHHTTLTTSHLEIRKQQREVNKHIRKSILLNEIQKLMSN